MRSILFLLTSFLSFALSGQAFTYGVKLGTSLSKVADVKLDLATNAQPTEFKHLAVLKAHAGVWASFITKPYTYGWVMLFAR